MSYKTAANPPLSQIVGGNSTVMLPFSFCNQGTKSGHTRSFPEPNQPQPPAVWLVNRCDGFSFLTSRLLILQLLISSISGLLSLVPQVVPTLTLGLDLPAPPLGIAGVDLG